MLSEKLLSLRNGMMAAMLAVILVFGQGQSCDPMQFAPLLASLAGAIDDDLGDLDASDDGLHDDNVVDPVDTTDTDGDGISDEFDFCDETPIDAVVDEVGCECQNCDEDDDGVSDVLDSCPETAADDPVDEYGCSEAQGEELDSLEI